MVYFISYFSGEEEEIEMIVASGLSKLMNRLVSARSNTDGERAARNVRSSSGDRVVRISWTF